MITDRFKNRVSPTGNLLTTYFLTSLFTYISNGDVMKTVI